MRMKISDELAEKVSDELLQKELEQKAVYSSEFSTDEMPEEKRQRLFNETDIEKMANFFQSDIKAFVKKPSKSKITQFMKENDITKCSWMDIRDKILTMIRLEKTKAGVHPAIPSQLEIYKNNEKNLDKIEIIANENMHDKRHYCYFCGESQSRIWRHMKFMHRNEPEVKKMEGVPQEEVLKVADILKARGNYKHNMKVIQEGKGYFVVTRVQKGIEDSPDNYASCQYCFRYFRKDCHPRHVKKCELRPDNAPVPAKVG